MYRILGYISNPYLHTHTLVAWCVKFQPINFKCEKEAAFGRGDRGSDRIQFSSFSFTLKFLFKLKLIGRLLTHAHTHTHIAQNHICDSKLIKRNAKDKITLKWRDLITNLNRTCTHTPTQAQIRTNTLFCENHIDELCIHSKSLRKILLTK